MKICDLNLVEKTDQSMMKYNQSTPQKIFRDNDSPPVVRTEHDLIIPEKISGRRRSPNKESFYWIEENAQQAIKLISPKYLNVNFKKYKKQMKFMIKPQLKIVYLGASLLSLIAGIDPNVSEDLLSLQDIQWSDINKYFLDVTSIINTFSMFKEFLRQRKILTLHFKVSKMFLQKANELPLHENKQQQIIVDVISKALPQLHIFIKESYHPAYIRNKRPKSQEKTDRSNNSNVEFNQQSSKTIYKLQNFDQIAEATQLFQQIEDQLQEQDNLIKPHTPRQMKLKDGHFLGSAHASQRSSCSITPTRKSENKRAQSKSSRKITLQSRVQIAKLNKVSRLDRILGLRVKKPVVASQFSQAKILYDEEFKIKKPLDQKIIIMDEIEKNMTEIKVLQREESNFKWQVEREVKQLQKNEKKHKIQDDINRYKLMSQNNKQIFDRDQIEYEKIPQIESCKSEKKNLDKENYTSIKSQQQFRYVTDSNFIIELKRELMNSQRTKEELTENLLRTLNVRNSLSTHKMARSFLY